MTQFSVSELRARAKKMMADAQKLLDAADVLDGLQSMGMTEIKGLDATEYRTSERIKAIRNQLLIDDEIETDLSNLTQRAAIETVLNREKRAMTREELFSALQKGGCQIGSLNNLSAILSRFKGKHFENTGDGRWRLHRKPEEENA